MTPKPKAAIIGGGPAGLFAAETLAGAGVAVTIYERMPSVGRKFLMAGRGGLNLTHSEPLERFLRRYGEAETWLGPLIRGFPPAALTAWCEGLGQDTFVGSSGRVFPRAFKASPLLRAWLGRLERLGVGIVTRADWRGWAADGTLRLATPDGELHLAPDVTILTLGGASWPRLGADGSWTRLLTERGVAVDALSPSNVGVRIRWSEAFLARFEGVPLKGVAFAAGGFGARGEAVVTRAGLEGGAIYAINPGLRAALDTGGSLLVDLKPDLQAGMLAARLSGGRAGDSLSTRLRKRANLAPVAIGLLREAGEPPREADELARRIKALPLAIEGLGGLERAISSAGGVRREALDGTLMLKALPGVFAAGEMLGWDAPTGGYLLQASFATGKAAAEGALEWLARRG